MAKVLSIIVLINLLFLKANASQIEYDGYINIRLEHSLDGSDIYTDRGNITIQSLRSGVYTLQQKPLSIEDRNKLRVLAADNKFYQLKATVISNEDHEEEFKSYVKACMLAESEMTDQLSISLDYTGRIITVSMGVASTSTCEGALVPIDYLKQFVTSVHIRHSATGPTPDTASYIEKLEREREAKERGEVKDNRPFLAKYWMYIVPVVIIMLVTTATNPEGGNAGGGSGGGGH
ncbi:hypothetical protein QE152_g36628 [Popillia japonica]|uniref:ER membrane protein complex subunit 10 n=1 Tax=Popillia japonica TaxID=7064 RepID=A0AAW1ID20_POPJA